MQTVEESAADRSKEPLMGSTLRPAGIVYQAGARGMLMLGGF
jgi:hypothetical protein